MLIDAETLFYNIQFHNSLTIGKEREDDLQGRLFCLVSDPDTPSLLRRLTNIFIARETNKHGQPKHASA